MASTFDFSDSDEFAGRPRAAESSLISTQDEIGTAVCWGAIIAGALAATALTTILLVLAVGAGLSIVSPQMSLAGKTIFISGGSRGIGLAIALRAARDGANIVVAAKTAEPWHGQRYPSLSVVARKITGAHWSVEVRLMSPEYSTASRESAEERSRRRLAEKPGAVVKQTMLPVTSHVSLEFVGLVLNFFEAVFDKIEHVNDSAQQPIPCDRHALNLVFVH
jgi:hypothetical protein